MAEYRNTYNGTIRTSSAPLGYPWVEVNATGEEVATRTIEAIMKDVGDNADLARAALYAEKERETPRTTLLTRLQAVIDASE